MKPLHSVLLASVLVSTLIARAQVTVAPDRTNGIYAVGDTVHWTITSHTNTITNATYVFKSGGLKDVGHGNLVLTNNAAQLETKFDAPDTMLVEVKWAPGGQRDRAVGGAVAAPEKITAAAPPPADFDSFWRSKLDDLKKIPANPQLEQVDIGKSNLLYYKVTLDNINGTHVQGQLARPAKGDKFPALLVVQWAGVYALQRDWVTGQASAGWLTLDVEAHDIPIDKPESFYKEQANGPLHDYWYIGNDDREKSYFLRMYLGDVQALEYLKTRPDWNGKTLVVMGTSQGGQQTLMLAGLHPADITAALPLVPSGCDMLAPAEGRASAYPNWYTATWGGRDPEKVHETSRYFDVVNFARHIQCPVLLGLGLRDETCPPATVLAAANVITSPKQIVILPASGHQDEHGTQQPYEKLRYNVWLPALAQGKPAPVQ
jgi:cephalosporin-C deacetylase